MTNGDGAELRISFETYEGFLRPKGFFVLSLKNPNFEAELKRYVNSGPILLRLRLWVAKVKLIKTHRKLLKFLYRNSSVRGTI